MRNRGAAVLAFGMLVAGITPASAASVLTPEETLCARTSSPQGSRFDVNGSGAQGFVGGWVLDGPNASLCFRGAGGAGGPTTVVATWTSPWADGSYEFEAAYSLANPSSKVVMIIAERSRFQGDRDWSPWFRFKMAAPPPMGSGGAGGGGDFIFVTSSPNTRIPKVRWQWRIEVQITDPTLVDASASISVD